MSLSYLSFYNQYFSSPINLMHRVNTSKKIFIAFIFLNIIPYSNYTIKLYLFIFLTYLYYYIKYKKNLVYIINLSYYTYLSQYIYKNKILDSSSIKIYLPNQIKSISYYNYTCMIESFTIIFNIYVIPQFIIKIFNLQFIYLSIIDFILKSTKYESIIYFYLNTLKYINIYKSNINYKFIFILSLTSQFLQRVINNLNTIFYSILLKYKSKLRYFLVYSILKKSIRKYILMIYSEAYYISRSLWLRELCEKNFKI
uniref:Uncharacterized protein n=1 Tax=Dasya naccarioides TaxID=2007180 RepID=A0A1Z1MGS0_9FLOR|nr:hypothetical protein [Dasya naccarioides]ARW65166.1 hypothetical protein [Dasya naccarioides]